MRVVDCDSLRSNMSYTLSIIHYFYLFQTSGNRFAAQICEMKVIIVLLYIVKYYVITISKIFVTMS